MDGNDIDGPNAEATFPETIAMPWGEAGFGTTFNIRTGWGFETGKATCETPFGTGVPCLRMDGDDREPLPRHVRLLVSGGMRELGDLVGDPIKRGKRVIGWMAQVALDPGTGKPVDEVRVSLVDAAAPEEKRFLSFAPSVKDDDLTLEVANAFAALAEGWKKAQPGYVAAFYATGMRAYREDRAEAVRRAEAEMAALTAQRDEAEELAAAALAGTAVHTDGGKDA